MKTIFPSENGRNDQINLKITSNCVELDVKTILSDEIDEKNVKLSSLDRYSNCKIPSAQFW